MAVIIDLFSRQAAGWIMNQGYGKACSVKDALSMACRTQKPLPDHYTGAWGGN